MKKKKITHLLHQPCEQRSSMVPLMGELVFTLSRTITDFSWTDEKLIYEWPFILNSDLAKAFDYIHAIRPV